MRNGDACDKKLRTAHVLLVGCAKEWLRIFIYRTRSHFSTRGDFGARAKHGIASLIPIPRANTRRGVPADSGLLFAN